MSNQARELNQFQRGLGTRLNHIIALINELRDDHETNRTSQLESIAATNELVVDHETFKLAVDALVTLTRELRADHATNKLTIDGNRAFAIEMIDDHADIITLLTEIKNKLNIFFVAMDLVLAKMDSDSGIGDTDYQSIYGIGGSDSNAIPASVTNNPPPTLSATDPPASAPDLTAPNPPDGPDSLSATAVSSGANKLTAQKINPLT